MGSVNKTFISNYLLSCNFTKTKGLFQLKSRCSKKYIKNAACMFSSVVYHHVISSDLLPKHQQVSFKHPENQQTLFILLLAANTPWHQNTVLVMLSLSYSAPPRMNVMLWKVNCKSPFFNTSYRKNITHKNRTPAAWNWILQPAVLLPSLFTFLTSSVDNEVLNFSRIICFDANGGKVHSFFVNWNISVCLLRLYKECFLLTLRKTIVFLKFKEAPEKKWTLFIYPVTFWLVTPVHCLRKELCYPLNKYVSIFSLWW